MAAYTVLRENPAMVKAFLREELALDKRGLKHWGVKVRTIPNGAILVELVRNNSCQALMYISTDRDLQGSIHHVPGCNCASLVSVFADIHGNDNITLCARMALTIHRKLTVRKLI